LIISWLQYWIVHSLRNIPDKSINNLNSGNPGEFGQDKTTNICGQTPALGVINYGFNYGKKRLVRVKK